MKSSMKYCYHLAMLFRWPSALVLIVHSCSEQIPVCKDAYQRYRIRQASARLVKHTSTSSDAFDDTLINNKMKMVN